MCPLLQNVVDQGKKVVAPTSGNTPNVGCVAHDRPETFLVQPRLRVVFEAVAPLPRTVTVPLLYSALRNVFTNLSGTLYMTRKAFNAIVIYCKTCLSL